MVVCPVVGIDVSKRFSDFCILTPENQVYARQKVYHDLPSLEQAAKLLQDTEKQFGSKPILVMEATSHYHLVIFQYFERLGYEIIVVNPLQSSSMKDFEIRKRKTDTVDAFKLAMLYRTRTLRPSQIPQDSIRALRMLCRERAELLNDVTRFKNRLTAYLDQVFPGYSKVFSDVGGKTSRAVLNAYPIPSAILSAEESDLVNIISKASFCGMDFASKKAAALQKAAQKARIIGLQSDGDASIICTTVSMLEALFDNVAKIEQAEEKLLVECASIRYNAELLQTIPGIGKHTSLAILSEIGDFSLFGKAKQLAAYFGLDPSERQSGTFRGTKNKISKRGSPYARAALHMAAHNAVCKHRGHAAPNPVLSSYYEKKCQTKPTKVAQAASMHKLVFIIFAVLRDQKPFELRDPEQHKMMYGLAKAA